MDERFAIHLARRRLEEAGAAVRSQVQQTADAPAADLEDFQGQRTEVGRRGRAGQIDDGVERAVDRDGRADIGFDEAKSLPLDQTLQIVR